MYGVDVCMSGIDVWMSGIDVCMWDEVFLFFMYICVVKVDCRDKVLGIFVL